METYEEEIGRNFGDRTMTDYKAHIGMILSQMAVTREQLDIAEVILSDVKARRDVIKQNLDTMDAMVREYSLKQFNENPEYDEHGNRVKKINENVHIRELHKVVVDETETFMNALEHNAPDLLDIADGDKAVRLLLELVPHDKLRTVLQCNVPASRGKFEKDNRNIIEAEVVVEYTVSVSKNLGQLLSYNKE